MWGFLLLVWYVVSNFSLNGLLGRTGVPMRVHLPGTRIEGVRLRRNQRRFIYHVRSNEVYSDPRGHLVGVLYHRLPSLDKIKDVSPRVRGNPGTALVRCGCSCPAWRYWGPSWHSTRDRYRLPKVPREDRSPDVRDPARVNYLCKHGVRVGERMRRKSFPGLLRDFKVVAGVGALGVVKGVLGRYLEESGEERGYVSSLLSGLGCGDVEDFCVEVGMFPGGGGDG